MTGCDILRAGQDKATGLQALLDHLGLAAADCVAVGDGPNDAGMLALAGRSYCMADGMKTAKAAAKALAPAAEVISGLIADEAAIGMVNSKTTAVRVIPAIGHKAGDVLDFGGLLGHAPIMPISQYSPAVMIHRGGRIPAPMQALKN